MARSRSSAPPPGPPTISASLGANLIRQQIAAGKELLDHRPIESDSISVWDLKMKNYLERAFGVGSDNVASVTDVGMWGAFPMDAGEEWWEAQRAENLKTKLSKAVALAELLETEVQLAQGAAPRPSAPSTRGHGVFLVHGHNNAALQEAARFLERLKQKVIVLREQPDQGRTIIEKFEDYSDVGFAVVLFTPDDRGGPIDSEVKKQKPRARQNVVLELGYFLGRLGRQRVCVLFQGGVEVPSDYSGVLYVPMDDVGAWRLQLARELKAAGLSVDLNLAV